MKETTTTEPTGLYVRSHQTRISSGFHLFGAVVENGGSLVVDSGGSATDVTVHYGGQFTVNKGGIAKYVVFMPGAHGHIEGEMREAWVQPVDSPTGRTATIEIVNGATVVFDKDEWQKANRTTKSKK